MVSNWNNNISGWWFGTLLPISYMEYDSNLVGGFYFSIG
jgi:hypothetical protein